MFFRQKKVKDYTYLQIVENRWEDGKTRQRVLATVGRLDQLQESGQLDALLESGARFAHSLLVLSEPRRGELPSVGTRRIGAPMVFERLWQETGCSEEIRELLAERSFGFPVERAIFLEVLHRLVAPGSWLRGIQSLCQRCKRTLSSLTPPQDPDRLPKIVGLGAVSPKTSAFGRQSVKPAEV